VDEVALIEALRAGRLGGAGLDATTVEPLPPESPLWTLPRVIITPHVSAGTDRVMTHLTDFWCENLRRFAEGEALLGVVNRHEGY
jgi:phosphoglycerate dehydrogenase-like enzyme